MRIGLHLHLLHAASHIQDLSDARNALQPLANRPIRSTILVVPRKPYRAVAAIDPQELAAFQAGIRRRYTDDQILGEQYWRIGAYLEEVAAFDEVAPGVDLLFVHRPLSRYVRAMGRVGLLIEDMTEETPPPRLVEEVWGFPAAATIPRVMLIQAVRREG